MSHLLRLAIICLLLATLPIQAVAAATMLFCAQGQHHASRVNEVVEAHDHASHSAEHAQHSGQLAQNEAQDSAQDPARADSQNLNESTGNASHTGTDQAKLKWQGKTCGACFTCVNAMGMPTKSVQLIPARAPFGLISATVHPYIGVVAEGLLRPPRTLS